MLFEEFIIRGNNNIKREANTKGETTVTKDITNIII